MSYGMRAKPKQGGAVDRQRLTPLTTGARQTPLYGIFIDLRKAYDAMDRDRCLEIMEG